MCGFVGLVGVETVAPSLFLGLQAIQHRGQDAAGIGTWNDGHLTVYKDVGKVSEVFTDEVLRSLPGTSGVAHVRYPTVGSSTRNDAQPFMTRRPGLVLVHNGNLTNIPELAAHVRKRGMRAMSECDAEPILLILGDELLRSGVVDHTADQLVEALRVTMHRLKGGYASTCMMNLDGKETLVAFRDPHGIRPAVYGRRSDGAWAVASESVCLDVLDFDRVADVPPGTVVLLRKGEEPEVHEVSPKAHRHCIFEDIYFARPDSVMEGRRVYEQRWRLGEKLAEEWKQRGLEADVVVAVPDTSRPAAQAMAESLGLPYREGFIKNRYSERTFIMPDQASRDMALRVKLNPIEEVFRDKRVIIVDDSIVRGTTMRRIVQMLRGLSPKEIHVAIFSPAVRHPCFYGIDMPTRNDLVAHDAGRDGEDMESALSKRFNASSVTFVSEAGLRAVTGDAICAACFTGEYPVPVKAEEAGFMVSDRQSNGSLAAPA